MGILLQHREVYNLSTAQVYPNNILDSNILEVVSGWAIDGNNFHVIYKDYVLTRFTKDTIAGLAGGAIAVLGYAGYLLSVHP